MWERYALFTFASAVCRVKDEVLHGHINVSKGRLADRINLLARLMSANRTFDIG
jgi:hypothetical protein